MKKMTGICAETRLEIPWRSFLKVSKASCVFDLFFLWIHCTGKMGKEHIFYLVMLLLMVQKSGKPVEVGTLSHYL